MASPIVDLHVQYVLQYALKVLRANPELYMADIFGQLNIEPHAALLGKTYMEQLQNWIKKTDFPVVLGYNIDDTKIPGISVALANMAPVQPFLGDRGMPETKPIEPWERPVIIPPFQPQLITFAITPGTTQQYAVITPPADWTLVQQAMFFPGTIMQDAKQQEFIISTDPLTNNPRIDPLPGGPQVDQLDSSSLRVISPYHDAVYKQGNMYYKYNLTIRIYSKSDRQDGLWLWQIAMWALLKYRPLLISLFGMDLAFSSAGDYMVDSSKAPAHVWMRDIQMETQAMWAWTDSKQQDVLGFLQFLQVVRANLPDPAIPLGQIIE